MVKPLHEVSQTLMEVVQGRSYADTVITNGTIVNVVTGELIAGLDLVIKDERIAFVGAASQMIGEVTQVVDATGKYVAPGLMDGHMHVESTMFSVTGFSEAAVKKGTTAVFMDPHEMANVFGIDGVKRMHAEGQQAPIHVFTTFPSCVPATDDLEDAGATISVEDVEEGLTWDGVVGLGEVMNYPGVIHRDEKMMGEIDATLKQGYQPTGHFPEGTVEDLTSYLLSGVTSCHETVTKEAALEKLRLGMYVMIREGSAWQDVKEVIKVITEDHIHTDHVMLVTDDIYPETLIHQGQINHVVRRAIEEGVDPVVAIKLATLNTARYFKLDDDYGSLTPGKVADIILLDDLSEMNITDVFVKGNLVVKNKQLIKETPVYTYPEHYYQSVNVGRHLTAADFNYQTTETTSVNVNAIEVIENSARTKKKVVALPVKNGVIEGDVSQDVIKLSCIDRHHQTGQISNQFVTGFKIKQGAVASTVAHDSHNLLVMGVNEHDMAMAANYLSDIGGGMVCVLDGEVIAAVPLPIAGLMSDQKETKLLEQVEDLKAGWVRLGSPLHAPFMTFSLIALPVIPDIRISNRGLVDVTTFNLIETICSEDC
ncbi:adenine deaminase [Halolactibacillus halophilus]|uniref:Adenine deaminase n=1 Tax=Halolactibacillus halophilus TaxID=306540 RepID=A0A1I5NZM9_9BACI|nr:adenine deaminase [Halolactibacillus halophilus]GEM01560.1 adenine deaminase [Halolactibacillus halophilus]SFP27318.1 adenine deaminase [Halolactibacillus halophilus]